jgi:two-component system, NarL family, sensor kinase
MIQSTQNSLSQRFPFKATRRDALQTPSHVTYLWVVVVFSIVIFLEYSTPAAFVFGYLYTGAIVLAPRHLSRQQTVSVTLFAIALTLLNLIFPRHELLDLPTVANRLIASAALLVTGYLSYCNRLYEDEITRQQVHIQTQAQLAGLREDFVSTLTHDLKTPLLGAIETVKSFRSGQFGAVNPTQRKVLEMMSRSHQSTLQLVETVLDVYRNDAEGLSIEPVPLDLRSLMADTITALTALAQDRQIYFKLISQGQSFCVRGDALQLRRVFENLLINAINHAPRGTQVEVILERVGHNQQMQVRDRGPGIAAHELPHLFERFYQGYSNRQAKGSGLGLYLSRQIVEAHGGKIWAQSRQSAGNRESHLESYGEGATFFCRFPACP